MLSKKDIEKIEGEAFSYDPHDHSGGEIERQGREIKQLHDFVFKLLRIIDTRCDLNEKEIEELSEYNSGY